MKKKPQLLLLAGFVIFAVGLTLWVNIADALSAATEPTESPAPVTVQVEALTFEGPPPMTTRTTRTQTQLPSSEPPGSSTASQTTQQAIPDPDPTSPEQVAAAFTTAYYLYNGNPTQQAIQLAPYSTNRITASLIELTTTPRTKAATIAITAVSQQPRPPATESNIALLVEADIATAPKAGTDAQIIRVQQTLWLELQADGTWQVNRILPTPN